jgi:hypothetical protein
MPSLFETKTLNISRIRRPFLRLQGSGVTLDALAVPARTKLGKDSRARLRRNIEVGTRRRQENIDTRDETCLRVYFARIAVDLL